MTAIIQQTPQARRQLASLPCFSGQFPDLPDTDYAVAKHNFIRIINSGQGQIFHPD
jgi:hypothetical protein